MLSGVMPVTLRFFGKPTMLLTLSLKARKLRQLSQALLFKRLGLFHKVIHTRGHSGVAEVSSRYSALDAVDLIGIEAFERFNCALSINCLTECRRFRARLYDSRNAYDDLFSCFFICSGFFASSLSIFLVLGCSATC